MEKRCEASEKIVISFEAGLTPVLFTYGKTIYFKLKPQPGKRHEQDLLR